jgi:hypothetical protein
MTLLRSTAYAGLNISDQLFKEAEAMATYALSSGLRVPGSTLETVACAEDALKELSAVGSDGAVGNGARPSKADVVKRLTLAHEQLARIVAPATPRTLLLLSRERDVARLAFLGPVRLVRQMMIVAVVLLGAFILTALSPDVNGTSGDIFSSSGLKLLVNEMFLLSAAGIGAAFTALFRANRYIANGTYDPKYESSYWVRFILGLIAGIVLPVLIPIKGTDSLSRPLLALVGGFSASVVYRILSRLVETVESLFQGDQQKILATREMAVQLRTSEQRVQDQLRLASALMKLRGDVDGGSDAEKIKASVTRILDELVPFEPTAPDADPAQLADGDHSPPVTVS